MGECINLRRGGKAKALPVLNPNFPADVSTRVSSTANVTFEVEIAKHGYPAEYTYKWYQVNSNGTTSVLKSTGDSHTYPSLLSAGTWGIYCEVTNEAGTIRSRTATLKVERAWLYNSGDEYKGITGGFQLSKALESSNTTYVLGDFWRYADSLCLNLDAPSAGEDGFIGTINTIDITGYSKIQFVVSESYTSDSDYPFVFSVTWINNNNGAVNGNHAFTNIYPPNRTDTSQRTYTVDVSSLNGWYYIGFCGWIYKGNSYLKVKSIELIP